MYVCGKMYVVKYMYVKECLYVKNVYREFKGERCM
jgi:hypothetical protein